MAFRNLPEVSLALPNSKRSFKPLFAFGHNSDRLSDRLSDNNYRLQGCSWVAQSLLQKLSVVKSKQPRDRRLLSSDGPLGSPHYFSIHPLLGATDISDKLSGSLLLVARLTRRPHPR